MFYQGFSEKIKKSFQIDPGSLNEFYHNPDHNTYVMIEASTNTFKFVELLRDKVRKVIVANTYKLKLISHTKKKTDKVDAKKLAVYLKMEIMSGEELISSVYIPNQKIQDLRSLFVTYKLIRKETGALKNRIHALLKQNLFPFTKQFIFVKKMKEAILNIKMHDTLRFQISLLFETLDQLEDKLQKVKEKIYLEGSFYRKQIDILTSMKGVSVITALAIIADVATIKRFPNCKHFTSYLRSAPGIDNSNETHRVLNTNKQARKLSITFISQSLNHFRDNDPRLRGWNDKLNSFNKPKGKIRMGLCRKVFAQIYQMLKKEEYHWYRDSENHKKKMMEYDRFLEKNSLLLRKSA